MSSLEKPASRSTFLVPALAALLFSVALFVAGRMFGSVVVVAASVQWFLTFGLILSVRSQLLDAQAGSMLTGRRIFAALLFLTITLTGRELVKGFAFLAPVSLEDFLWMGFVLLGSAAGSAILATFFRLHQAGANSDVAGLVKLCRIGSWLGLLGSASVFAQYFEIRSYETPVSIILLVVPGLIATELLLRGLYGFIRRPPAGSAFGSDLLIVRLLGSSYNPIQSLFNSIEDTFGVDVRSSWALGFMRRVSFPLIVGMGLFAWALSALVIVDESQLAVRERLGKVAAGEVLQPGLNVGLPWPFDRVQVVDTERVRTVPLGFSGQKTDADALWTQYHAAEEYNLLIGNGRDLVTINAELQYRISDIHDWVYGCQNPDEALETLAYRVIMEATVGRTLDEVLSKDIGSFSARMQKALQAQADQKNLGVELVALNLRGLHPPVVLATEYQSVIAAQLDRATYIIDAEAFRQGALPEAEAEAETSVRTAAADRVQRIASAKGEAIAFETLEAQYSANPGLYRFRRRIETLEKVLPEQSYHVIDSRIERDGGAVWFLQ